MTDLRPSMQQLEIKSDRETQIIIVEDTSEFIFVEDKVCNAITFFCSYSSI